jgi:predicted transcriptional regulator
MSDVKVHVGENAHDMGVRFTEAWKRAEAGADVHERHLTFETMESLTKTLTPKRVEMVRAIRMQQVSTVRELARVLKRDVKNVHGDLKALVEAGVIDQDETGIHTDVTHISTMIAL